MYREAAESYAATWLGRERTPGKKPKAAAVRLCRDCAAALNADYQRVCYGCRAQVPGTIVTMELKRLQGLVARGLPLTGR